MYYLKVSQSYKTLMFLMRTKRPSCKKYFADISTVANRSSNVVIVIVEHVVSCFQYTLEAAVLTAYFCFLGYFQLCGRNRNKERKRRLFFGHRCHFPSLILFLLSVTVILYRKCQMLSNVVTQQGAWLQFSCLCFWVTSLLWEMFCRE